VDAASDSGILASGSTWKVAGLCRSRNTASEKVGPMMVFQAAAMSGVAGRGAGGVQKKRMALVASEAEGALATSRYRSGTATVTSGVEEKPSPATGVTSKMGRPFSSFGRTKFRPVEYECYEQHREQPR